MAQFKPVQKGAVQAKPAQKPVQQQAKPAQKPVQQTTKPAKKS